MTRTVYRMAEVLSVQGCLAIENKLAARVMGVPHSNIYITRDADGALPILDGYNITVCLCDSSIVATN